MDFYGLTIGLIAFPLVFLIGFFLLSCHELNRGIILRLVGLSGLGHILGGFAYYWLSITSGSDSIFYWQNATSELSGFGYHFAFYILWLLRTYILSDSLLGAFLLSAALGFLGSIFYLLTFKILLDRISDHYRFYLIDPSLLHLPAFLLLCWPPYFFWSAGLIKDNFAFLSIGIFLYCIAKGKLNSSSLLLLLIAFILGFLIRPYLFIILCFSIVLYILINKNWNPSVKIGIIGLIACIMFLLVPRLIDYSHIISVSGKSLGEVATFALDQQKLMNIGSSIPIPTHNAHLLFFFLPYLMFANLFLPLGIGANNLIGLISSVENAYLLWLVIFFLKNRKTWRLVIEKSRTPLFFMVYFSIGIACLGLMNTNLGAAMREKMMYVPPLLINILLVYAYRRVLIIEKYMAEITSPPTH